MQHNFKFPRFALLVNKHGIRHFVEGRYYDADKNGAPIYLLTPETTDCPERWGAEYVDCTFSEYVKEEENESH